MKDATHIVNTMFKKDAFSQWLNITILSVERGFCVLTMKIRPEMLNGFNIAHGGLTYALSDSAFAFASNSMGFKSVSIETSIAHVQKVQNGDELTATARQITSSKKIGRYEVEVKNQHHEIVALFKGTVYITSVEW